MPTSIDRDPDYPRPDFDRSERWMPLDGRWDFAPDPAASSDVSTAFAGEVESIAVPGPWETSADGGRHDWLEVGWYRRRLTVPAGWTGERIVLHFGAVFHQCDIWVDGRHVGTHTGGYLPFSVDVTEETSAGEATLVVRVVSPKDKRDIPHGKQRSLPYDDYNGCSFTPTSGIWQSVWLEPRPATYIEQIALTPASTLDGVEVVVTVGGRSPETARISARLVDGGLRVGVTADGGRGALTLPIAEPRLWSPSDPHLYEVEVVVESTDGTDRARSYTGLRTIEARGRALFLNGERIYLRGVLDQGYWPGTGLTAPGDAALRHDLELARDAGFTLVRKHLKAEDPRWLFHADVMGMLVWSEPACPGRYSPAGAAAFEAELTGLIERDRNHPSIVIWSAYNEEWGLDWDLEGDPDRRAAAARAYRLIRETDPTRLAIDNSGWTHVETDLLDWHYYNENPHGFRHAIEGFLDGDRPDFEVFHTAEYPIPKSLGASGFERTDQPIINSEYGGGWNSLERAWHSRWQTQFLRLQEDNQGYVYTELYDIEHETVGVYAFDRSSKDEGGFAQRDAHADTVLIPVVAPIAVGADLIVAGGTTIAIPVVVSHHGSTTIEGSLTWSFGAATGAIPATAAPFRIDGPHLVELALPEGYEAGTLTLALDADGTTVARTFVDLREHEPATHLPPDPHWRAQPVRPERSYRYDTH